MIQKPELVCHRCLQKVRIKNAFKRPSCIFGIGVGAGCLLVPKKQDWFTSEDGIGVSHDFEIIIT